MVVADEWGKWDDPVHEEFLAKVEKLPNRWFSGIVRVNRERHLRGPVSKPAVRPEAKVLPDAEVAFHPIGLSIAGERGPFRGHVFSWIRAGDGIDAVLGDTAIGSPSVTSLFLMKEKGRLTRLPLECCEAALHSGANHNLCWDGRLLWVASPDRDPRPSEPSRERFLAVVEPRSEQITRFTAEDGLPPMKNVQGVHAGAAAVAALGPGKAWSPATSGVPGARLPPSAPNGGNRWTCSLRLAKSRKRPQANGGRPKPWHLPSGSFARSGARPQKVDRPSNECFSLVTGTSDRY